MPGRMALVVIAVALAACESSTSGPGAERSIDRLPTLTLQEERRIGSFDDPDVGFSRIGRVRVDPDGRLMVYEASAQEIRVYDDDGTVLRRIGREGEGPGEFMGLSDFGVVGDTVWAVDSRLERITLLDRSGAVFSTSRFTALAIPTPECYGYVRPTSMRDDGFFVGSLNMIACGREEEESDVEEGDSIPVPRVLFDATGAVVDTIGWDPSPPPRMVRPPDIPSLPFEAITVGEERYRIPTQRAVLRRWEVLPDGRVVLDVPEATSEEDATFSVTRIGLSGDTVFHRVLHYRPRRYSEADLDSIAVETARTGGGAVFIDGILQERDQDPAQIAAAKARVRDAMDFPEYRLPVRYPWVADDGSVWLLLDVPESEGEERSSWIVLDPAGVPKGRIDLPVGARPLWARGDTVWASVPDELEVPWLVRYGVGGR